MHAPEPASCDPELAELQRKWSPGWKIWRARRSLDPPNVCEGEFVASRMDDAAGIDRTIMRATADELDAELTRQKQFAERGAR